MHVMPVQRADTTRTFVLLYRSDAHAHNEELEGTKRAKYQHSTPTEPALVTA